MIRAVTNCVHFPPNQVTTAYDSHVADNSHVTGADLGVGCAALLLAPCLSPTPPPLAPDDHLLFEISSMLQKRKT